jgi:hypothetical protein|tara:strand:+ start:3526 stop:3837 length:312 start_codon:yes stop_codon:yes gene_type:complete
MKTLNIVLAFASLVAFLVIGFGVGYLFAPRTDVTQKLAPRFTTTPTAKPTATIRPTATPRVIEVFKDNPVKDTHIEALKKEIRRLNMELMRSNMKYHNTSEND